MPFQKLGPDRYRGPSGKVFDYNQVKLYYSRGGNFPGQKSQSASTQHRSPFRKQRNQHSMHR